MQTYDFAFVILHYITLEDTMACLKSIKENISKNYAIVIVDNCSPNDSYPILQKELENECNVFLLKNKQNLGFARGNNVGYLFAREQLKSKYIFCINNDTKILQNDIIDRICALYEKYRFDLLGPDIISLRDGMHQNPLSVQQDLTVGRLAKSVVKLFLLMIRTCFYAPQANVPPP